MPESVEKTSAEQPVFERVLGFDYGGRRIGTAIGQRFTGTAQALTVVRNGDGGPDWQAIDAVVKEWRPDALLIGLPLDMEGNEQPMVQLARRFGRSLQERYRLPVLEHDERLSSREADRQFAESRRAGRTRQRDAAKLDALAARIIVESYFTSAPR
jgi:putative holliday junction resolvase